jgi:uncharacterized protein YyaL (SSP411 family)
MKAIKQSALQNPTFNSYWLSAVINLTYPLYELGIIGENYQSEREKVSRHYLPNIILFGGSEENELELLKNRYVEGKTLFYVCENRVCQLPEDNLDGAIQKIMDQE